MKKESMAENIGSLPAFPAGINSVGQIAIHWEMEEERS